MEKYKMVALEKNKNGKCLKLFSVQNVCETHYKQLVNEYNEEVEKERKKNKELCDTIDFLKNEVELLKKEISYLKGESDYEENK